MPTPFILVKLIFILARKHIC